MSRSDFFHRNIVVTLPRWRSVAFGDVTRKDMFHRLDALRRQIKRANPQKFSSLTFAVAAEKSLITLFCISLVGFIATPLAQPRFKDYFVDLPLVIGDWGSLCFVTGVMTSTLWVIFRFIRKEHAKYAQTVRRSDTRKPILFLRNFRDDDEARLWGTSKDGEDRLENVVSDQLAAYGPVITVGEPGEPIRYRGAARQMFSNETWQSQVGNLMDEARLIVLVPSRSAGLTWELTEITKRNYMSKLIVLIPPSNRAERLRVFFDFFPDLPNTGADVLALSFTPWNSLVVISNSGRIASRDDYFHALLVTTYCSLCHNWPSPPQPERLAPLHPKKALKRLESKHECPVCRFGTHTLVAHFHKGTEWIWRCKHCNGVIDDNGRIVR